MAGPHEPFDRRRRRARRDRAASRIDAHGVVADHIAAELLERLAGVRREIHRALIVGASPLLAGALCGDGVACVTAEAGGRLARAAHGVQCDEDRLPFADGAFDLVVSAGVLDAVNDLPGALILMRRALRPDGLLLAGFAGAGSLPVLRDAMLAADLSGGAAAARLHPQVDVRAAGDLLGRAGFALPVADAETLTLRYGTLGGLIDDLRYAGMGGALADRAPPLTRAQAAVARERFMAAADADGRVAERVEIVYLTGWSPDASQPAPAPRGSATASLAGALGRTR